MASGRNQFSLFSSAKDCKQHIENSGSPDYKYFQTDCGDGSGPKRHIACTYEQLYDRTIDEEFPSYHEAWIEKTPVKFVVDYDRRPEDSDPIQAKEDVREICVKIKQLLRNVTEIVVLKSISETFHAKNSYHIIFNGVYFKDMPTMGKWAKKVFNKYFKPLVDRNILDTSIYSKAGCIRSAWSSKPHQRRPLCTLDTVQFIENGVETEVPKTDFTFSTFLKSCITAININGSNDVLYIEEASSETSNDATNYLASFAMENDADNNMEGGGGSRGSYTNSFKIQHGAPYLEKYVRIMSRARAEDPEKADEVLVILKSVDDESGRYKAVWREFCKLKGSDYDESEADAQWHNAPWSSGRCVSDIKFLASQDDYSSYADLEEKHSELMLKKLYPDDLDVAEYVHNLENENHVCASIINRVWYAFRKGKWIQDECGVELKLKMFNDIRNKIITYGFSKVEDENEKKKYVKIAQIISQKSKINGLDMIFFRRQFADLLDTNLNLMGFENGVLDVKTGVFRKSNARDYMSMSTGYFYSESAEKVKEMEYLEGLIEQIFPDPEIRQYTMETLASCLSGETREQNFYMWTGKNGCGGSGKSTLQNLQKAAFGQYADSTGAGFITNEPPDPDRPNPAMYHMRHVRALSISEIQDKKELLINIVKALTGGDMQKARALYSNAILEFKPEFTMFLLCNWAPGLSAIDGGMIRRLRKIPFSSKFKTNPSTDPSKHEYPVDFELLNKIPKYGMGFMLILKKYFRMYIERGGLPPAPYAVVEATRKYEADNNLIAQFIAERVRKGEPGDCITQTELTEAHRADFELRRAFPKVSDFRSHIAGELDLEFEEPRTKKRKSMGASKAMSGSSALHGYKLIISGQEEEEDDDDVEVNDEDFEVNEEDLMNIE